VQPTIKVPVGYRFNVRVNRDIAFDAPYSAIFSLDVVHERKRQLLAYSTRGKDTSPTAWANLSVIGFPSPYRQVQFGNAEIEEIRCGAISSRKPGLCNKIKTLFGSMTR
jgi:hypothetical protein